MLDALRTTDDPGIALLSHPERLVGAITAPRPMHIRRYRLLEVLPHFLAGTLLALAAAGLVL